MMVFTITYQYNLYGVVASQQKRNIPTPKQLKQKQIRQYPYRLLGVGGVGVVDAAFAAGSFWSSRRMRASSPVGHSEYDGFT